jgi:GT2 family glycosyltransferase
VSVVVPLYNCLPLTQAMLASLHATLPPDLPCEIILIDDGSTDGTREWLADLTRADRTADSPAPPLPQHQVSPASGTVAHRVLLNDGNLGFAASNNRAAAVARGEILVLLNNDLVLLPRWLEPMLAAHAHLGPRAGLIGNVQLDAGTGVVDHAGLDFLPTAKPVHLRTLPPLWSRLLRPFRPVPAVTAACVLLDRALWQQLGGFDEAFVNGGEDIDLCYRAHAVGRINAVALRSVVHHHVSSAPGRKRNDEQNSYRLVSRWHREFSAGALRPWCRDYLSRTFVEPRDREYRVVLSAAAYLLHLRPTPPPAATASVALGLAREFSRWETMFPDGLRPSKP